MKKIILILLISFSFFIFQFEAGALADSKYYFSSSKSFAFKPKGDHNGEHLLCSYNYVKTYTYCKSNITSSKDIKLDNLIVPLDDNNCDSYIRDNVDEIDAKLVITNEGDVRIRTHAPYDDILGYNTSTGYYYLSESGQMKVNITGGDQDDYKRFIYNGWCPTYLVIDEHGNDRSGGKHTGYYFFGKYGMASLQRLEERNQFFKLDTSNDMDLAFSPEDTNYVGELISDFSAIKSNKNTQADYTACDLSSTNSNSYYNIKRILKYVKEIKILPYTMHEKTEWLLDNNGYNEFTNLMVDVFSPSGVCYNSEYANENNLVKYDEIYDLAKNALKEVDIEKNTITSCDKLLGSPEYKSGEKYQDVAFYIQKTLDFARILGPVLIIAFSIYDYIKAIPSGDKDALNKVNKKTVIRVVAGVALFFAPILIKALFTLLGLYNGADCNIV